MKILVAGGTGVIGCPLLAKLLANGHAVVPLQNGFALKVGIELGSGQYRPR